MQSNTSPTGSYSVTHEKESHLPPDVFTQTPPPPPTPNPPLLGNGNETRKEAKIPKRPGEPLEISPSKARNPKNARLNNLREEEMAPIPPSGGVGASMHAPHNQSQTDLNMSPAPTHPDTDPASSRPITKGRITIRNLQYAAAPLGGFPIPQITKPVTAGQSPLALRLFEESPEHKIWVRPWGMKFTKELHLPRQELIKTMLDFFDREPDDILDLSQPSSESNEAEADGSPWNFMISGLTKMEHDMAIETRVIASRQATLFITAYTQQIPNFVMMIMGISYDKDRINEAEAATAKAFQRTLSTDPLFAQTLMNLIEDPTQVYVEFESFLSGITATHTPVPNSANIYWCINSRNMPNFTSIEDYNTFVTSFANLKFFAGRYGTGEMPRRGDNFSCNQCKSRDHHSDNCPFPKIPGWLAPIDTAFPWTDPAKKKTSTRGRGRGGAPNNRAQSGSNNNYRRNR